MGPNFVRQLHNAHVEINMTNEHEIQIHQFHASLCWVIVGTENWKLHIIETFHT